MIDTLYADGTLGTARAFLIALLVGVAFGVSLERAGFGSSRRLAGIFYFRDMTVLKVMFSAMVTAMLGLAYLTSFGWIALDRLYLMPTVYWAQILGGLAFGVGFVMSGWCPGTAAVGLASGKMDALIALVGVVVGSILFNEVYPAVESLGVSSGVLFVYESLGLSQAAFTLVLAVVAVAAFWGSEYVEKVRQTGGGYFNTPFLRRFGLVMILLAAGTFLLPKPSAADAVTQTPAASGGTGLLETIESGGDHIEPEELADRLMAGEAGLLVVDVRSAAEFGRFHIRGAVNIPLSELPTRLAPHRNHGLIVLYSNGMTHPAQARDELSRQGFDNVYILTDGLTGFIDRCLKPVSLRSGPLPKAAADRVNAWREFFTRPSTSASARSSS